MDKNAPLDIRVSCYKELAQYVYAKRRPVDGSSEERTTINLNTNLDKSGDSDVRDKCQPEPQASPSSGI